MTTLTEMTADLLASLRPRQTPALLWHGADGERIELSGRVTDNWVAKTANLLAEEFDIGQGDHVSIRLGDAAHWRGVVFALAAWSLGATAGLAERDGAPRPAVIVVTPGDLPVAGAHGNVIAVALPGLAMGPQIPAGSPALDYAIEVRGYSDVLGPQPPAGDPSGVFDPAPAAPLVGGGVHGVLWGPRARPTPAEMISVWRSGAALGLSDISDDARLAAIAAAEGMGVGNSR